MVNARDTIQALLQQAGIAVNGYNPWDITVHNEKFFSRVLTEGSLGLGESYMEKWWDCQALDVLIYKLISLRLDKKLNQNLAYFLQTLWFRLFNFQKGKHSYKVANVHYDLGNDLFQAMLDPLLVYSCAYWDNTDNLAQAQINKLELICKKLYLQPGMKILDIGCGWGSFAKYAASKYKAEVVAITISKQQEDYAKKNCQGLPVTVLLQDYRDIEGKYDRIVSVGMFEHVGYKNYGNYMKIVAKHLDSQGLFLLHTIGNNISAYNTDPWFQKYIFPNGMLPSIKQIGLAVENIFLMEDWHNLSINYDKTLLAWYTNFINHWPYLSSQYDEQFYRMWTYYLLSCAGAFRARYMQLWQIILTHEAFNGAYQSLR